MVGGAADCLDKHSISIRMVEGEMLRYTKPVFVLHIQHSNKRSDLCSQNKMRRKYLIDVLYRPKSRLSQFLLLMMSKPAVLPGLDKTDDKNRGQNIKLVLAGRHVGSVGLGRVWFQFHPNIETVPRPTSQYGKIYRLYYANGIDETGFDKDKQETR